MDFVAQLIQEGCTEEEIGVILETLYQIDIGGESEYLNEAVLITESRYARLLAKLRAMPQTPAIKKQIKRIQDLMRGSKDKADDVTGAIVKKSDDINPAKPPTGSSRRPSTSQTAQDTAKKRQSAKDQLQKRKEAGTTPTPTPTPDAKRPPGKWKRRATTAAALGAGAATYLALTGKNGGGDSDGGDSGSPGSTTPGSTTPGGTTPGGTTPGSETSGNGSTSKSKGKFWWSTLKPKRLGYQMEPSRSSYRNIRSHNELEGNFINEAHETVVNYLISNGHADTIEEANYVMNQMEFDHIQEIVNENI